MSLHRKCYLFMTLSIQGSIFFKDKDAPLQRVTIYSIGIYTFMEKDYEFLQLQSAKVRCASSTMRRILHNTAFVLIFTFVNSFYRIPQFAAIMDMDTPTRTYTQNISPT